MSETPWLTAEHSFLALESMFIERRAAFRRKVSIAFATLEGERFLVDTAAPKIVERGWRDNADITVLTNARTLSDWLTGKFDPESPEEEHLFMWGGDGDCWSTLANAFADSHSAFAAHLNSLGVSK